MINTAQQRDALLAVLSDPGAMKTMLAEYEMEQLITEEHRSSIKILHRHFVANEASRQYQQHLTNLMPRPARAKSSANLWSRFMRIKELQLPDIVIEHIAAHGTQAGPFVSRVAPQHQANGLEVDTTSPETAFTICYHNTTQLKQNIEKDRIMWLFHMLHYYDLCQILRPGMKDVGIAMLSEVQSFLKPLLAQDPTLSATKAARDVYEWCNNGARVNVFVSRFGPGCIFLLANQLSADFIKKNKKIKQTGAEYDAAMNYLDVMLQLSNTLEESRAGELGEAIREHLIRPLRQRDEGIDECKHDVSE